MTKEPKRFGIGEMADGSINIGTPEEMRLKKIEGDAASDAAEMAVHEALADEDTDSAALEAELDAD